MPGRFSDLFSSRDVGRLLAYRPPRSIDGLLLIKEGRHRNENWMTPDGLPRIDKVRAAWREGYTLVINKMEQIWEPIGRFGSTLEEQLHHPVGINLYITPARAQGFHAHFDVMDGFILQLEGSKVWQVRGPQVDLPMSDEHTSTPPDNLLPCSSSRSWRAVTSSTSPAASSTRPRRRIRPPCTSRLASSP
ncbi:JmjC domain-containing protein [Cystobacter fuscus]